MHTCRIYAYFAPALLALALVGCGAGNRAPESVTPDPATRLAPCFAIAATDARGTTMLYDGAPSRGLTSLVQQASAAALVGNLTPATGEVVLAQSLWQREGSQVGFAVSFDPRAAALTPEEIARGTAAVQQLAQTLAATSPSRHGSADGVPAWAARWFETFEDPVENPTHTPVATRWSTQEQVIALLTQNGMHMVPQYAAGAGYGTSYAMFVNYVGRPMQKRVASYRPAAYRHEAQLQQITGQFTYCLQRNEPNPELAAYAHPAWWWSWYVWWWHATH